MDSDGGSTLAAIVATFGVPEPAQKYAVDVPLPCAL